MYDVIVVGTGGVGSAVLYHAARRGARVLGLDRFPAAHDRGSSHGDTRIIRLAYFEHPDYVPLLRRAYELWSELERAVQQPLYDEVGLLEIGPVDGEVVPGVLRSAALHGLEIESLDAASVARRFPGFRVPDGYQAVFERRAGYLRVERCVLAHLQAAVALGAEQRVGGAVRGWRAARDHLWVDTDAGPLATRRLVVTPGAWAGTLLADIPIPWRVLLKHLHWFAPRTHDYRAGNRGCTFFYEFPWGMFYGFPQVDELGVKMAEHSGGVTVTDPLCVDRSPDPLDRQRVETFLGMCLPGMTRVERRHATCFYTMTPDGHFVVDRHPQDERLVFAAGLSGHGFKFTSVLGEVLAHWALEGAPSQPVEFLGLQRFGSAPPPDARLPHA
ncbi:MAG: N-methyl-L-tryptophan oxidase [Pirellulales bacterium]